MTSIAASQTLAANSTSWLFTGVGIVVVAVLLLALWFGSRRAARKPMPPQEPQPRADSWGTPDTSQTPQDADPDGRK